MEPEGSLPQSQVPVTCPYPEPARSSPYPQIPPPKNPSYYYTHFYAWVSKWSLSLSSPHQNSVHASPLPIRATRPPHLILLDLINRTILGEQYRSHFRALNTILSSKFKNANKHWPIFVVYFETYCATLYCWSGDGRRRPQHAAVSKKFRLKK